VPEFDLNSNRLCIDLLEESICRGVIFPGALSSTRAASGAPTRVGFRPGGATQRRGSSLREHSSVGSARLD
jgi:hypothetical protein